VISRPVEDVFESVADERREPNFNTRMSGVELLKPEQVDRSRTARSRPGERKRRALGKRTIVQREQAQARVA
jgi:hypothetical protein